MPSGRSGSRGRTGSSRSGGSSRTGSSRGGFSSPSSHRRTGGTTVIVAGGRRRYGRRYGRGGYSTMSTLGAFALVSLIVAIIGFFVMLGAGDTMKKIKTEHIYYQNMITANVATREAKVTDIIKNDKGNKWWFEYEIIAESGDEGFGETPVAEILKGFSLPIYDLEQLPALNSTITVVLSLGPNITLNTNSVPNDLALTKPENDGDYIGAKSTKNVGYAMVFVGGALFVLLIILEVSHFAKAKRQTANDDSSLPQNTEPKVQPIKRNCPYCGASVDESDKRCRGCGAKV